MRWKKNKKQKTKQLLSRPCLSSFHPNHCASVKIKFFKFLFAFVITWFTLDHTIYNDGNFVTKRPEQQQHRMSVEQLSRDGGAGRPAPSPLVEFAPSFLVTWHDDESARVYHYEPQMRCSLASPVSQMWTDCFCYHCCIPFFIYLFFPLWSTKIKLA